MTLLGSALMVGSDAHARGFYVEGEYADTSVDGRIPFNTGKIKRDFDDTMLGVGFLFDSNVATDALISYRFRIGYRHANRTWDEKRTVTFPRRKDELDFLQPTITFKTDSQRVQGVTFNQTLGFGLLTRPEYRLWAGPSVRLNVDWYGVATGLDIVDVSAGGGPEIGVNYHLGDTMSISASFSYSYMYFGEHFETKGNDLRFDGSQHLLTLSIGFMFRSEYDRFGE